MKNLTSTDAVSHIKITQAGLISLLVTIVGQVVAFVPSLASKEQVLISAGSTVIAAVFLVANAVHALASSKTAAVAAVAAGHAVPPPPPPPPAV